MRDSSPINTLPPSGTRDFLPEDVKNRERVFNITRETFENFGFLPIDTPALERVDSLTGKYGEAADKLIFKILKRGKQATSGEADLALRYDLTVPLARFFSRYQSNLPKPFRRYQIGSVWRADRPGKGRFREFYQCDVDVVGSSSILAEAEVVLSLTKILSRLGLNDYVVLVNSRKVLEGILQLYEVPQALRKKTLITLDKLDKIGVEDVVRELKKIGVPEKVADNIKAAVSSDSTVFLENKKLFSEVGKEGVSEVRELKSLIEPIIGSAKVKFSPFLARGLDYYTGIIFEIYLKGVKGAIASGGRYDNLIGMFAGRRVVACGGSFGVDRLLSIKSDLLAAKEKKQPRFFITVWDKSLREETLSIADKVRQEGFCAEISLDGGRISSQVRSALTRGAGYCVFYGPKEKTVKELRLKDFSTGVETNVKLNNLGQGIKSFVKK